MDLQAIASVVLKTLFSVFLALMPILANATPHGTFSSLEYNSESGDLNGYEIEFVPTNKGLKAVIQVAEGEIDNVCVVDVDQGEDGGLSFSIPLAGNKGANFVGRVSKGELRGTIQLPAGPQDLVLRRTTGYWNKGVDSP